MVGGHCISTQGNLPANDFPPVVSPRHFRQGQDLPPLVIAYYHHTTRFPLGRVCALSYPLALVAVCMDSRTGRPDTNSIVHRDIFSTSVETSHLLDVLCGALGVDADISRMLVKAPGEKHWKNIDPGQTLEEAELESGDFIMVETRVSKMKSDELVWPRDLIKMQERTFREFEINARVDGYDQYRGAWFSGTIQDFKQRRKKSQGAF